jgi:hypothetical protein
MIPPTANVLGWPDTYFFYLPPPSSCLVAAEGEIRHRVVCGIAKHQTCTKHSVFVNHFEPNIFFYKGLNVDLVKNY